MKRIQTASCMILLILFFSSGCIKPAESITRSQFLLDVPRQMEPVVPARTLGGVLLIQRFGIRNSFAGRGLVYKTSDVNFESDFYNEFLTSPDSMLADQTLLWLSESGLFEHVISPTSHLRARYVLEANVLKFYSDFSQETAPQAVVEIQFMLTDTTMNENPVIFHQTYRASTPISNRRAEEVVRSLNASIRQILVSLEQDLQTAASD